LSENNVVEEFITVEELTPNSRRVNLKVKVVSKNEEREVVSRKTGETLRVTEALVGDETGTVYLTLWNEDVDKVKVDQVIQVENGFVSLFKGFMRLNIGKYGTLKEIESEDFGEVNQDKNMSDQEYQTQQYQRPRFQRGPSRGGYRRPYRRR
jgi:replication factor A1